MRNKCPYAIESQGVPIIFGCSLRQDTGCASNCRKCCVDERCNRMGWSITYSCPKQDLMGKLELLLYLAWEKEVHFMQAVENLYKNIDKPMDMYILRVLKSTLYDSNWWNKKDNFYMEDIIYGKDSKSGK